MKYYLNLGLSGILTTISYLLGGLDLALKTLLIVIAIDYVTGVLKAIYEKKLNSKIGVKGIIKKVGYLFIVALSVLLDNFAGNTGAIRSLVIYFFVANEGISIIENWACMDLPIPNALKEALEQLKEKK